MSSLCPPQCDISNSAPLPPPVAVPCDPRVGWTCGWPRCKSAPLPRPLWQWQRGPFCSWHSFLALGPAPQPPSHAASSPTCTRGRTTPRHCQVHFWGGWVSFAPSSLFCSFFTGTILIARSRPYCFQINHAVLLDDFPKLQYENWPRWSLVNLSFFPCSGFVFKGQTRQQDNLWAIKNMQKTKI